MSFLFVAVQAMSVLLALSSCGAHDSQLKENRDPIVTLVLGSQLDPELTAGPGAGVWNSEPKSFENRIIAESALKFLATGEARRQWGDEAAGTFHHYFENNGRDYKINVSKMLKEVPSLQEKYEACLALIDELAAPLADGEYMFTTKEAGAGAVSRQESENWYLAVAGYRFWIKGTIAVVDGTASIAPTFNIWDRYDWDPGVKIPIDTPLGRIIIDQERVGEFHRQGLAKEFNSFGTDNAL